MNKAEQDAATVAGVLVLFLFAVVGVFMFWPYNQKVRLAEKTWSRTIQVERWQQNTHEGWDVPPGGVVVHTERRKKGESRYQCGTKTEYTTDSDGNRQSKTVPVYCTSNIYDDWYVYTLWEWTYNRAFVAAGDYQQPPAWPETPGVRHDAPINPERLGRRLEVYHVVFIGENSRVFQSDIDRNTWNRLNVEQTYTIETNNTSMVLKIIGE